MAVTTNKTLLFLAGGVAAAAAVAYGTGAFDPLFKRPSEQIASLPQPAVPAVPAGEGTPVGEPAAQEPAATNTPAAAPETPIEEKTAGEVVPPSFDVVRLEGDGSIVIAGEAAPNAKVDLLVGSNVIGSAVAGTGGDFAVVLDEPLKPGDYQIVLRATAPDNVVAMSVETAVVSVPSTPDGQVLALVEEAGKPSQMITLPEPQTPAAVIPQPDTPTVPAAPDAGVKATAETPPAAQTQAAAQPTEQPAATQPATEQPAAEQPVAAAGPVVRVEAVEIDGRKVFVAGAADPGRLVRGYANEILLGDAKASPDGRFLIEIERELPVGDYIIRVDALEPNGDKVVARAAVPFEREPGETIAAVAAPPEQPAASAPAAPAETPAAVPSAAPVQPAAAPAQEPAAQPQVAQQQAAGSEQSADAGTAASGTQAPASAAPEPQPSEQASAPLGQAETQAAAASPAPEAAAPPTAPATDQPATGQSALPTEDGHGGQNAQAAQPAETAPAPAGKTQTVAEALVALSIGNTAEDETTAAGTGSPAAQTATETAAAPENDLPAPPVAEGVTETLAPKLQSVGGAIIIRRGDTLWRISRRVYGQGVRYSTIYLANQTQIEDPDRIWPGQVFKVPQKSADGEVDADYSGLGNRLTTVPADGEGPPQSEAQP
jgi:nucleoid-associated protein YgaU